MTTRSITCTGMIPISSWIVYDCSTLRTEQATTLTTTRYCRDHRGTSRSRSYYKLNRIFIKRVSRVTVRKNTLISCTLCITRRIMKKKADEKREKISSKTCRLVEELHAPARRNFPRRRVIVRGYDDLWQADIVEMRPYSGFNRGHHYIPSSMC